MLNPTRLRRPLPFERMDIETQMAASAQFHDAHPGDGMLYVIVGKAVTSRFLPAPSPPARLAPLERKLHFGPKRWWGEPTGFDFLGGGSALYYEALCQASAGQDRAGTIGKFVVDDFGDLVEVRAWRGRLGDIFEYFLVQAERDGRARRLMDYWCRRQALVELREHFEEAFVTGEPDGFRFFVATAKESMSIEISPAWLRDRYRSSIGQVLGACSSDARIDDRGRLERP